jgi:hypothetical protein
MNIGGRKHGKKPSRADLIKLINDLQQDLQQEKAASAQLFEHLNTMGPQFQGMMQACFESFKIAHKMSRALQMSIAVPERERQLLAKDIGLLEDMLAPAAISWRATIDPGFVQAEFISNTDKCLEDAEAFDKELIAMNGIVPVEVKCTKCDWEGFKNEALNVESEYVFTCPICNAKAEEVYEDGN